MKNFVVNKLMDFVSTNKDLDEIKKEELRYGFSSIYLTYSKLIVLTVVSILLGFFKEFIIFLLVYNLIRTFSFGLHATKSWMCWIASTIIFLGIPIISRFLVISQWIKVIIGAYLIIRIFMNAPADTKKRPIVSEKRRTFFKYASTLISIIYIIIAVITKNNLVSNILFLATLTQCIIISPYTYRLFNLPFNNYKDYIPE